VLEKPCDAFLRAWHLETKSVLRDGDWGSDSHVACHHYGDLHSDFGALKVDEENDALTRALSEISMNIDECCHQEKVACCAVWASMNDQGTL
jgi:hypothetical protein